MPNEPTYFASQSDFRRWLEANHETIPELIVGFWKKGRGKPSIDWPQARDQALCFGWIDGVRKSLGGDAYTIRLTPRRKGSIWSKVNIVRFNALKEAGQVRPEVERAYEENRHRSGLHACERETAHLEAADEAQFRKNKMAWADWEKRAPGYRKIVLHWVTSARQPETRARCLATLIECSAAGEKIPGYDISRKK